MPIVDQVIAAARLVGVTCKHHGLASPTVSVPVGVVVDLENALRAYDASHAISGKQNMPLERSELILTLRTIMTTDGWSTVYLKQLFNEAADTIEQLQADNKIKSERVEDLSKTVNSDGLTILKLRSMLRNIRREFGTPGRTPENIRYNVLWLLDHSEEAKRLFGELSAQEQPV